MQRPVAGAASWLEDGNPGGEPGTPNPESATPPGASRGWTAPLKPGLIPLRPLTFAEILGASFRLLRTSPGVTVGSAIIVLSVISVISGVATGLVSFAMFERAASASTADRPALETTAVVVTLLTAGASVIFSVAGTAILQGILAHVVARATLAEKVTFGGAWRAAWRRFWPLLGYSALVTFAALIALALVVGVVFLPMLVFGATDVAGIVGGLLGVALYFVLILGMLAISAKLLFAPAAIVLEGLGPIAALRRSWKLTKGHFWRIVGITLLVQLIAGFAAGTVSGLMQIVFTLLMAVLVPLGISGEGQEWIILTVIIGGTFLMLAVQVVVSALTLVLTAGNAVILYVDVRNRKEGLNVHLQRAREAAAEGRDSEDPFRAPPVELPEEQVPQPRGPQGAFVPPPGYAPPGYAPQGYAPPGYAQPGYAPPGYAPSGPAYGAPGYSPPSSAPHGSAQSAPGHAPAPAAGPAPYGYAPAPGSPGPAPAPAPAPGPAPTPGVAPAGYAPAPGSAPAPAPGTTPTGYAPAPDPASAVDAAAAADAAPPTTDDEAR